MKLAIIDLDGVVANVDARFAQAEEVKQAWLAQAGAILIHTNAADEREATNIYWRAVFDPDFVPLDTLIEGVNAALVELQYTHGWRLTLLTSRPESMREATVSWLAQQLDAALDFMLVMKPAPFQYTKTVTWKAGTIAQLAAMWNVSEVLVVDDEQANLAEIGKYPNSFPPLFTAKSLPEAVAKLNGTWKEVDPFLPPD